MIREAFLQVLENIWPMILIFSVVLISIRITFILRKKEKIILHKELLSFLFILYILFLFYVVTFQDVSSGGINFIPFKEMFRYEIGSHLFMKNVIGNVLIFMPYGFFVSSFLTLKKPNTIIILTFITSLTIEVTQGLIGRIFDIDDIFLNIMGGLFGYLSYYLIIKSNYLLPKFLRKDFFYDIITIVLMIISVLYFFKVIGG